MRLAESRFLLALGLASACLACPSRARSEMPISPTGRHWVFFQNKEFIDAARREDALSTAQAELLPRAAWRRQKVMSRLVDDHDLPIDPGAIADVRATGATVVIESRWLNAVSVRADVTQLRQLRELGCVREIRPVAGSKRSEPIPAEAPQTPASPYLRSIVDYGLSYDQLEQIKVPEVHFAGYDGEGVIIAVLDTGFEYTHPVFANVLSQGRLLGQHDFVKGDGDVQNSANDHPNQHDHGTKVWSTIAGYTPGQLVGSAYHASFLLAKTEDVESETPIEEDYWIGAAEWADVNGADVISSSLSYVEWYSYEDMDGDTAPITRAADLAAERGMVVCIAAGNLGSSSWYHVGAPADADSILTVGAVDEQNRVAEFSSRGPTFDGRIKPEVVARGVSTYTAMPLSSGLEFWWNSGTSFSCPLVAGAAALVLEANPEWTPWEVREAFLRTADHSPNPDNERGWGLIDAWAALNTPVSAEGLAGQVDRLRAFPNPALDRISFASKQRASNAVLEIFAVSGVRIRVLDFENGAAAWSLQDDAGRSVAPGVYFARLAETHVPAVKLVVR